MKKLVLASAMLCLANVANAAIVNQHVGSGVFARSCPGVNQPGYMQDWRDAIAFRFGVAPAEVDSSQACIFNSRLQGLAYDQNGVPVDGQGPSGAAFGDDDVGIVTGNENSTGGTFAQIGEIADSLFVQVQLDDDALALPTIKVKAEASDDERVSANGFAATEYLWTGDDETLEFTADFDFFTSGGEWNVDGASPFYDYIFNLSIGASTDMVLDDGSVFPFDFGTEIASANFNTVDLEQLVADEVFASSIQFQFDVTAGDEFYLYGLAQALALNGGFTDASGTITTKLTIEGLTEEESLQIFETALTRAPVSEPAMLAMMLLGLFGALRSRKA